MAIIFSIILDYDKDILTFREQLALLEERGLFIDDWQQAEQFLTRVSYYRLSGYWWSLQEDTLTHEFEEGVSFEEIIKRYTFDRKLRLIVFDAIERIEIALRTSLIYFLSHETQDWNWFENLALFKNEDHFHDIIDSIERELTQTKLIFIREHNRKYGNVKRPPSLKTLEVTSLGTLSKLYYNLKSTHPSKAKISNSLGLSSVSDAESWLRSISSIRNKVAHHSRLWNEKLPFQMSWLKNPQANWISKPDNRGIQRMYYFLSGMIYLLEFVSPGHNVRAKLKDLLNSKPRTISLRSMGFPQDWEKQELWK